VPVLLICLLPPPSFAAPFKGSQLFLAIGDIKVSGLSLGGVNNKAVVVDWFWELGF